MVKTKSFSGPQTTAVEIQIPTYLLPRLRAAAAKRGLDMSTFVSTMILWHAPAPDNADQTLRKRLYDIVSSPIDSSDMVDEIEELLK